MMNNHLVTRKFRIDCVSEQLRFSEDDVKKALIKISGIKQIRKENNMLWITGSPAALADLPKMAVRIHLPARLIEQPMATDPLVTATQDASYPHEEGHGNAHDGHNHTHDTNYRYGAVLALSFLWYATALVLSHTGIQPFGSWSDYLFFGVPYLVCGYGILKRGFTNLLHLNLFDEFSLMSIATIAAILIGSPAEAASVMLFYSAGELLNDWVAARSRRSISALLAAKPTVVHQLKNGTLVDQAPEHIQVGDIIIVKPGERIPLDGVIISGISHIDMSPLTGESMPVSARPDQTVYSGTVNQEAALTIRVEKPYQNSAIARILDIVEKAAARKSPTERFITRFSKYYTPTVVGLAALLAILGPSLFGGSVNEWIYRALVILVISCPCALLISIPLGYFGGIGAAAKRGILIKGGNIVDTLKFVRTIAFDKTGTLTAGKFDVITILPAGGLSKDMLLMQAAIAESGSNHPIALSIRAQAQTNTPPAAETLDLPGLGIETQVDGHRYLAGNAELMRQRGLKPFTVHEAGTQVHIAQDGQYSGVIVLADQPKPEAISAIQQLKAQGIDNLWMLTGDSRTVAKAIAEQLQLSGFRAELLPEDKISALDSIPGIGKTAFVGDGFNDAPILATVDVGIAMGKVGSEAAIEIADVVILDDNPAKIPTLFSLAARTRTIIWQNIIIAIILKVLFLILGAFGIATLWEAIFADVGVAFLAVLNATRAYQEQSPPALA